MEKEISEEQINSSSKIGLDFLAVFIFATVIILFAVFTFDFVESNEGLWFVIPILLVLLVLFFVFNTKIFQKIMKEQKKGKFALLENKGGKINFTILILSFITFLSAEIVTDIDGLSIEIYITLIVGIILFGVIFEMIIFSIDSLVAYIILPIVMFLNCLARLIILYPDFREPLYQTITLGSTCILYTLFLVLVLVDKRLRIRRKKENER